MGAHTYQNETASSVSARRLYKALVLDFDTLIPKITEVTESSEILQGNGGPGTLRKITYLDGGEKKYVVEKVEEKDEEKCQYKYSVIEGSGKAEGVEKLTIEMKAEEAENGGAIWKVSATYFTKTDAPPAPEVLALGKAQGDALFKAAEGYLLAHPDYN